MAPQSSSQTAISVRSLSKTYRLGMTVSGYHTLRDRIASLFVSKQRASDGQSFQALQDISFDVAQGEVLGIVGANGAGKSTLLKILSRVTEPTTGDARLYGRVASLLEVGTGFHPELSGRENIFLNGVLLGMTRADVAARFDEIVAFAGIERFLDTPVKRYSSGMYVRLAFAVAAHLEPDILIVDEVLAVGDAAFQKKCLGKMSGLVEGGNRTILFVSHNLTAVETLCTRAILLRQGRLVAQGPPNEIVREYLSQSTTPDQERLWPEPPPSTQEPALLRVAIEPEDPSQPLTVLTPFDIIVEIYSPLPRDPLNISLHVKLPGGVCAFNTYSPSEPRPPGRLRFVCHVPARLLNDETYEISVLVVRDTSLAILHEDSVLSFSIADAGRSGNWHGKHEGVVRPHLRWTVNEPSTSRST